MDYPSRSERETAVLGQALARVAYGGLVVALNGELGAGKTRFVQAFAEGWGIDPTEVLSPTFGLVRVYEGKLPVIHVDAYRLRDRDEFYELGLEEIWDGSSVALIEWADRVAEELPPDRLEIRVTHTGENERLFALSGLGPDTASLVEQLAQLITLPQE